MKIGSQIVMFLCLASAAIAIEPKKRILISEVIELTGAKANLEALRQQQVETVKAALERDVHEHPGSAYLQRLAQRRAEKYDEYSKLQFSWYRLEDKYVAFYDGAFTEAQLRAYTGFLKSDAGRAMVQSGPQLMVILREQLDETKAESQAAIAKIWAQAEEEIRLEIQIDVQKLLAAPTAEVEVAARSGSSVAQYLMGVRLADGDRIEKNQADAVKWFRLAMEQNHVAATGRVGFAYWTGEGVDKDLTRARELLQKAAEAGDVASMYGIGALYVHGEGGAKDTKQGLPWLLKAANAGHAGAQYEVAVIYWNGDGVERNLKEAFAWVSAAQMSGYQAAEEFYHFMEGKMSANEISEGAMRCAEIRDAIAASNKAAGK